MSRVGQNHIYTVHIQYFWQGNHQIYGHIRCTYTVYIYRVGQNHIHTVYIYGSGQPYKCPLRSRHMIKQSPNNLCERCGKAGAASAWAWEHESMSMSMSMRAWELLLHELPIGVVRYELLLLVFSVLLLWTMNHLSDQFSRLLIAGPSTSRLDKCVTFEFYQK